jgi:DNA transposition AAA+ family ATPase
MAPEILSKLDADELRSLVLKVRDYQLARKLSDNALVKKFPGLGSSKTYTRILDNDLAELNLERQLANYRAVVALLEAVVDDDADREELYDDLTPCLQLRRVLLETMRESGNARVVVVVGDTGQGKTAAGRCLLEKFAQRLLWVEANECWGDSPMAMTGAILKSLGVREMPYQVMTRLDKVVERLAESRVCMVIDEAHHMGPRCLNTLKTLVNQTPGEFVLLAMPTLWRRLEREAYEEVRQLTGNRLAERIKLEALRESDLKKLIERRAPGLNGDLKTAVKLVADRAPQKGNLAFVRDVCKRAAELARESGSGTAITLDLFSAAVAAEMESR